MIKNNFFVLLPFLFICCATSASTQPTLQVQAEDALVADQPRLTIQLAENMLVEDPESFAALLLIALAYSDLGKTAEAVAAGRRAYAVANGENTRFEAARLVANAHFTAKQYFRSEFWLRRAANHAQTDEQRASISIAYFSTVRTNPLSVEFTAFAAPTSNFNDGSDGGVVRFEDTDGNVDPLLDELGLGTIALREDRRALSGVTFAAGVNLSYRVLQSPRQSTFLTASASGETYVLSPSSRELLDDSPDADVRALKGSDFANLVADIGIGHLRADILPFGPTSLSAKFGTYWDSGERLIDYQEYNVAQVFAINETSATTLRYTLNEQQALVEGLLDAQTKSLTFGYSRTLQSNDQLEFNLSTKVREAGFEGSFDEYSVAVGYGFAEPILNTLVSASLQLGNREYEQFTTTLDGRSDIFASAALNLTFLEVTYLGFSPSISLTASRTESTAEEITSSAVELLVGIESSF